MSIHLISASSRVILVLFAGDTSHNRVKLMEVECLHQLPAEGGLYRM